MKFRKKGTTAVASMCPGSTGIMGLWQPKKLESKEEKFTANEKMLSTALLGFFLGPTDTRRFDQRGKANQRLANGHEWMLE